MTEALNQHEHPFQTLKRLGHAITDAFVIRGWSELPMAEPVAEYKPPTAQIIQFPGGARFKNPNRVEDGWLPPEAA